MFIIFKLKKKKASLGKHKERWLLFFFFFLSWTLSRTYQGRDKCQHPTREKLTLKHESTDESESPLRHLYGNWKFKHLIFIAWNLVKNNRLNSCIIQEIKEPEKQRAQSGCRWLWQGQCQLTNWWNGSLFYSVKSSSLLWLGTCQGARLQVKYYLLILRSTSWYILPKRVSRKSM